MSVILISNSLRKTLLATQAGPQGAGVVFQGTGAHGRVADFLVAITPWERPTSGCHEALAFAWSTPPRKLEAALAHVSKENHATDWRYASLITPAALRPLESGACRDGDSSEQGNHPPDGTVGKPSVKVLQDGVRHDGEGRARSAAAEVSSMSEETRRGKEHGGYFRRKLAGLVGQRGRIAPGPGAALWIPSSKANVTVTGSPPPRPKKAKVRRLVRHLEAELKLKGRPGAGGLPAVGSQRVDFPYTKELAKWSYDEILGIPRTTAVPASSRLF